MSQSSSSGLKGKGKGKAKSSKTESKAHPSEQFRAMASVEEELIANAEKKEAGAEEVKEEGKAEDQKADESQQARGSDSIYEEGYEGGDGGEYWSQEDTGIDVEFVHTKKDEQPVLCSFHGVFKTEYAEEDFTLTADCEGTKGDDVVKKKVQFKVSYGQLVQGKGGKGKQNTPSKALDHARNLIRQHGKEAVLAVCMVFKTLAEDDQKQFSMYQRDVVTKEVISESVYAINVKVEGKVVMVTISGEELLGVKGILSVFYPETEDWLLIKNTLPSDIAKDRADPQASIQAYETDYSSMIANIGMMFMES